MGHLPDTLMHKPLHHGRAARAKDYKTAAATCTVGRQTATQTQPLKMKLKDCFSHTSSVLACIKALDIAPTSKSNVSTLLHCLLLIIVKHYFLIL